MRGRPSPLSVASFLSHITEIFREGHPLWFRIFLVSMVLIQKTAGYYHDFSSKHVSLAVLTFFVEEPLCVSKTFWYGKILWKKGRVSRFSVELVLPHSTEKFRRRILLCFRNFLAWIDVMDKERVSRFSVEIVLSHSTELFCRGTLQCFRKFPVSKNSKNKMGGSAYQEFPSKVFWPTVLKCFAEEHFCDSESLWDRNIFWIRERRGVVITIFLQNSFVPQYRKIS